MQKRCHCHHHLQHTFPLHEPPLLGVAEFTPSPQHIPVWLKSTAPTPGRPSSVPGCWKAVGEALGGSRSAPKTSSFSSLSAMAVAHICYSSLYLYPSTRHYTSTFAFGKFLIMFIFDLVLFISIDRSLTSINSNHFQEQKATINLTWYLYFTLQFHFLSPVYIFIYIGHVFQPFIYY